MVPNESGFNQSQTASGYCARSSCRFPRSSAMTRDGEVKQSQHFYHHGDTICHPKSGYLTAKLHGTSTCRCNINAIFPDRSMFKFFKLNSLFFVFKISFLPKYRVIYYDYIVKWCNGI